MNKKQPSTLTWGKTFLFVIVASLASILLSFVMTVQRIVLALPLTLYSGYFYLAVIVLPALGTFGICASKRPTGSRLLSVLFLIGLVLFFCFYLALLGPTLHIAFGINQIECQPVVSSGITRHQDCACKLAGESSIYETACSLDSLIFSPLVQITEQKHQ